VLIPLNISFPLRRIGTSNISVQDIVNKTKMEAKTWEIVNSPGWNEIEAIT